MGNSKSSSQKRLSADENDGGDLKRLSRNHSKVQPASVSLASIFVHCNIQKDIFDEISDRDLLKTVIKKSPESLKLKNGAGQLPLHLLFGMKSLDKEALSSAIAILIEGYPEGTCQCDNEGRLPIQVAMLHHSISAKSTKALIDSNPQARIHKCSEGKSILHYAAQNRRILAEDFSFILQTFSDQCSQRDLDHRLPLHLACRNSIPFDFLKKIIAKNVDGCNEFDGKGYLPIHESLLNKSSVRTIKMILSSMDPKKIWTPAKGEGSEIAKRREELRMQIIGMLAFYGYFPVQPSSTLWRAPRFQMMLYISYDPHYRSHTDKARQLLVTSILPKLRNTAFKYGIDVQYTDYHRSFDDRCDSDFSCYWASCVENIRRCRLESIANSISFISLLPDDSLHQQTQKRPFLPLFIDAGAENKSPSSRDLLNSCCNLDTNMIPPHFRLCRGKYKESEKDSLITKLCLELDGSSLESSVANDGPSIGCNVAEAELRLAIAIDTSNKGCLWLRRTDHQAVKDTLFDWVISRFCTASDNVINYTITNGDFATDINKSYSLPIEASSTDPANGMFDETLFTAPLMSDLERVITNKKLWRSHAFIRSNDAQPTVTTNDPGFQISGDEASEILLHVRIATDHCNQFYGRESLLLSAKKMIDDEAKKQSVRSFTENPFDKITLSIEGSRGFGKSSIMAKLAQQMFEDKSNHAQVIIRFCGSSPESSSLIPLLRSICTQIRFAHVPRHSNHGDLNIDSSQQDLIPTNRNKLIRHFQKLLHSHPIILFLDNINAIATHSFSEFNLIYSLTQLSQSIEVGTSSASGSSLGSSQDSSQEQSQGAGQGQVSIRTESSDSDSSTSVEIGAAELVNASKKRYRKRKMSESESDISSRFESWKGVALSNVNRVHHSEMSPKTPEDYCHLSFLSELEPHRGTRIIVSNLLIEESKTLSSKSQSAVGSPTKNRPPTSVSSPGLLRFMSVTPNVGSGGLFSPVKLNKLFLEKLNNSVNGESMGMIHHLLKLNGRQITKLQSDFIYDHLKFADATPQFIATIVRDAMKWTSFDVVSDLRFNASPKDAVEKTFKNLESEFGVEVTRLVMGFLTFSVEGVKGSEMSDLLAVNSIANAVSQREIMTSSGSLRKWLSPACIWIRIHAELGDLLIEREDGCLQWRLSCVREVAKHRYLNVKNQVHQTMACYFGDHIDPSLIDAHGILRQRIVYNDVDVWFHHAEVNRRRCVECVYHMIEAGMYDQAAKELCQLDGICARMKCHLGFKILDQLMLLKNCSADALIDSNLVNFYYDWLLKNIAVIEANPSTEIIASVTAAHLPTAMNFEVAQLLQKQKSACTSIPLKEFRINETHCWIKCRVLRRMRVVEQDDPAMPSKLQECDISGAIFSCDGSTIIAGSSETTLHSEVCMWDSHSGTIIYTTADPGAAISSIITNPSGSMILTSDMDSDIIRVFKQDKDKSKDNPTLNMNPITHSHLGTVNSVDYHPDKEIVLSGGNDFVAIAYDVSKNSLLETFDGHKWCVNCVSFSPDGEKIATASMDRTIMVWNLSTGNRLQTFKGHSGIVRCISYNTQGTKLVSGGDDFSAIQWDIEKGSVLQTLAQHTGSVLGICYSSDGTRVVTGSADGSICIWNVCLMNSFHRIRLPSMETTDYGTNSSSVISIPAVAVKSVCFSPDGSFLVSGSSDKQIRIWDAWEGSLLRIMDGHLGAVNSVQFSRDGSTIASGSDDKTIIIWNSKTGDQCNLFSGHEDAVTSVKFCQNRGAVVSGSVDSTVRMWSLSKGAVKYRKSLDDTDQAGSINSLAFHPNGSLFAVAIQEGQVTLWDAVKLKRDKVLRNGHTNNNVTCLKFTPDGSRLISADDGKSIVVWSVPKGDILLRFSGHTNAISAIAIWSDSKRFATSSLDGTIRVWSLEKYSKEPIKSTITTSLATFDAESGPVTSIDVGSDGRSLVSGFKSGYVKLWEVTTLSVFTPIGSLGIISNSETKLNLLHTFQGHQKAVHAVSISPDCRRILSTSDDKTIRIWDIVVLNDQYQHS